MNKKPTIILVAYPDRGAGNDPKLFFLFGGVRGVCVCVCVCGAGGGGGGGR